MSYNKKRFKFPTNCRMVMLDYPIDESKVVHKDDFVAGDYTNYRLSKNTNKSKIMTTERILALKVMKGIVCSTEQLGELQEMCDLYNDGEYFCFYSAKEDMEFFKIGYTTKTIHKRFPKMQLKKSYLDYEVIYSAEGTMLEMINKEQHLLRKFHKHRFKCSYNGFTATEAFRDNILSITEIETAPTSGVVSTLRYRKNKITLKNNTITLENESIRVVENAFEDWL